MSNNPLVSTPSKFSSIQPFLTELQVVSDKIDKATYSKRLSEFALSIPIEDLKSGLKDGADPFDVLGEFRLVLDAMTKSLREAVSQFRHNEEQSEDGNISVMKYTEKCSELSSCIEILVGTAAALLTKPQSSPAVCEIFRMFLGPLSAIAEIFSKKVFGRDLAIKLFQHFEKIIKKFHANIGPDPLDDSVMSDLISLLSNCNNCTNPSLRKASMALWNSTAGKSTGIEENCTMTMTVPLLSKDGSSVTQSKMEGNNIMVVSENDVEVVRNTPSMSAPSTPRMARPAPPSTSSSKSASKTLRSSAKKRVYALLDEDSVDYVTIKPADTKKMKLTDHQKEMFLSEREKLPYMDEDSCLQAPFARTKEAAALFDMDSSQSGSHSSKLPSVAAAPLESVNSEKDPLDSSNTIGHGICDSPSVSLRTDIDIENKDRVAVASEAVQAITCSDNSPSKESISFRKRASAVRLFEDPEGESSDEVSSVRSTSTDSDIVVIGEERRSRRTRSKKMATPSKFVVKKQPGTGSATCSPVPGKKRGRPKKIVVEKATFDSIIDAANETVTELTSDTKTEVASDVIVAKNDHDMESVKEGNSSSQFHDPQDPIIVPSKDSPKRIGFTSPEKIPPSADSAVPRTPLTQRVRDGLEMNLGTPGILKKLCSPSTSDKKIRRVHFNHLDNVDSFNSELAVTTPRSTGKARSKIFKDDDDDENPLPNESASLKALPEPLTATIFPELADCKDSVTAIAGKLVPVLTSTASTILKRSLEAKKIYSVGDLAKLTVAEAVLLNIKKPRVATLKTVLTDYAQQIGLNIAEQKESEMKESDPSAIADVPGVEEAATPLSKVISVEDTQLAKENSPQAGECVAIDADPIPESANVEPRTPRDKDLSEITTEGIETTIVEEIASAADGLPKTEICSSENVAPMEIQSTLKDLATWCHSFMNRKERMDEEETKKVARETRQAMQLLLQVQDIIDS